MHESQFSVLSSQFSEQGGELFLTNGLENECLYKFRDVEIWQEDDHDPAWPTSNTVSNISILPTAIWLSCFLTIFSWKILSRRQARICDFFSSSQSITIWLLYDSVYNYAKRVKSGPNLRFPPFTYILGTMRFAAPRLYAFGPLAAVFSLFCFRSLVFCWSLNNLLLQTLCIFWAFSKLSIFKDWFWYLTEVKFKSYLITHLVT